MGQADDIKIRSLPRSNATENAPADKTETTAQRPSRWPLYVSGACVLALALMIAPQLRKKSLHYSPKTAATKSAKAQTDAGQTDLSSHAAAADDSVSRYLQDAEIKRAMMMRGREIENLQFKDAINEPNSADIATLPDNRNYGVQMDSEDSAEKVFRDLNGDGGMYSETLPDDRINARLANRKWMNEQDRAERIQFVSNFIRSAYDRGYEVQIDQNLVVVGVRRINKTQVVNINQIMDRLAKQGF